MLILAIVLTFVVLAYNLFQAATEYSWFAGQVGAYREFVVQEQSHPERLRSFNRFLSLGLLSLYIGVLYVADLAFWVLGLVALKYLFTLFLSDRVHASVLLGRPFSMRQHRIIQIDAVGNAVLLALILVVCVLP